MDYFHPISTGTITDNGVFRGLAHVHKSFNCIQILILDIDAKIFITKQAGVVDLLQMCPSIHFCHCIFLWHLSELFSHDSAVESTIWKQEKGCMCDFKAPMEDHRGRVGSWGCWFVGKNMAVMSLWMHSMHLWSEVHVAKIHAIYMSLKHIIGWKSRHGNVLNKSYICVSWAVYRDEVVESKSYVYLIFIVLSTT